MKFILLINSNLAGKHHAMTGSDNIYMPYNLTPLIKLLGLFLTGNQSILFAFSGLSGNCEKITWRRGRS